MTSITESPLWQTLQQHRHSLRETSLRQLFESDQQRFQNFSLTAADLTLDYSKNRITAETMRLLCQVAETAEVSEKIQQLLSGYPVNTTEKRPALHTALRQQNDIPLFVDGKNIIAEIRAVQSKMRAITQSILQKQWLGYSQLPITDVVNIGIGGSDLGPAMAVSALQYYANKQIRCHFISNIDGAHIRATLRTLNPAQTLFIISSKSFSTQETLFNARTAKYWLQEAAQDVAAVDKHFLAVTAKPELAAEFGIPKTNILPIWDWVGGRFSLWSAVGLPIALATSYEVFEAILAGAAAMDEHFRTAPFAANMPVILALLSIWYTNFWGTHAHAIIPYGQALHLLPSYLQQSQMESLGKHVRHDGTTVDYATGMIIWGGVGTNGQHAYHQLLMQGTRSLLTDFILIAQSQHDLDHHHLALYANALSQSKALMMGKTAGEVQRELKQQSLSETEIQNLIPHKMIAGNCPSNSLVLPQLTPYHLGAMIALYEHKIFTQSVIWQINCFDQWGVELGKSMTDEILRDLTHGTESGHDASTQGLIELFRTKRKLPQSS